MGMGMRFAACWLILSLGATWFSDPSYAQASFRTCVEREAVKESERAVKERGDLALYGYHPEINKSVALTCGSNPTQNVDEYVYINSVVGKVLGKMAIALLTKEHTETDKKYADGEPRRRVQQAQRDSTATAYASCLIKHSRTIAINSDEPAETIARATFPTCTKERQAVFDIYKQHDEYFSIGAMNVMEAKFFDQLLLEIIGARSARANSTPTPTPPVQSPSLGKAI